MIDVQVQGGSFVLLGIEKVLPVVALGQGDGGFEGCFEGCLQLREVEPPPAVQLFVEFGFAFGRAEIGQAAAEVAFDLVTLFGE